MLIRTGFEFLSLTSAPQASAGGRCLAAVRRGLTLPRLAAILSIFIFMVCCAFTGARAIEPLRSFPPERFFGHAGAVLAVGFSPDGARIVSGSSDNTLKLWDAVTGMEVLTLLGHADDVAAAAFSPDGTHIMSWSLDDTMKLWDVATGAELLILRGHTGSVNAAAFSPDGTRIVSGSLDNTLKLWDVATGAELLTLRGHTGSVNAAAFSPDGARIVSGSSDGMLKLWDAVTGAELLTLHGYSGSIYATAFSPDGARIVSGQGCDTWMSLNIDCNLKLWDAATGVELLTLSGHADAVHAAAFSPDGTRIVSGSRDNTLKLWDAATGAELKTLGYNRYHYPSYLSDMALSLDGTRLVSGYSDGYMELWDTATGMKLPAPRGHTTHIETTAFSPDGARIVSGSSDGTLKLWDTVTGAELLAFSGHSRSVYTAAFSPDGTRIVSGGDGGKNLILWDAVTGAELLTFSGHSYSVYAAAFSPDGTRIVSMGDNLMKLWDAVTGAELLTFGEPKDGGVTAFSADGTRIMYGSYYGIVTVWDATTGTELLTFGERGEVAGGAAAFSADSARFVYGDAYSGILTLWDTATGAKLQTRSKTPVIYEAALSFTGRYIYYNIESRFFINVWDSGPTLALPGELSVPVGSVAQITPLSGEAESWFSADNAIAAVDANGAVTGMAPGNVSVTARDTESLSHTLVRVTADNAAASFGRAIVIAGGGAHSQNTLFPYSNELAGRMYGLLKSKGFADDEIYYFNPDAFQDIDADGLDDGITDYELLDPWSELNAAMNEIAPALLPGQQLVFYLHGHADNRNDSPALRLNQTSEISAAQFKELLARVPEHAQQVIILDTCHSGAFLPALAGHPRRIVLTSADADSKAWNVRQKNFSNVFINSARHGMNLNEAFLEAERVIKGNPEQFAAQRPLMDDDGDGFYSAFSEGRPAARTWLGRPGADATAPPEIVSIHPWQQAGANGVLLWAETFPSGPDSIRKVRAVINRAADSQYETVLYQGEISDYKRIEVALDYNPQQNRWETQIVAFPKELGRWHVMYEAQNLDGVWSLPLIGEAVVAQPPQAAFSIEPDPAEASRPTTFDASASMDPYGTISSYRWSMAGYSRAGENVTFTFADPGDYTVELTVTDNLGVEDTLSRIISVNDPPQAAFRIEPDPAEAQRPTIFDASASMDPDGVISDYRWSVAGHELAGKNVTFTFAESRNYIVELTVTDDLGAKDILSRTVIVNDPPQAAFRIEPDSVEASRSVTFDASASMDPDGVIRDYHWSVAGYEFAGKNVSVTFSNFGDYTLELTVTDNRGSEDTLSRTISVNDPPKAAFSIEPYWVQTSHPTTFDASDSRDLDGTISSYRWFMAGHELAGENVTFTFAEPGNYIIELTVTDNRGSKDTHSRTISVNDPPQAAFRMEPNPAEASRPTTFDASASMDPDGTISSYRWSITGGYIRYTEENMTFTFAEPGDYTVELRVMDNQRGQDTLSRTITVTEPPQAAFRIEPDPAEAQGPTIFDASASMDPDGAISSYHWSVAGNELVGENVTFTFDEAGYYSVELAVQDDLGARDTLHRTLSVLPGEPGRALLIAGGGARENNTLFAYSNDFVQRMYRLLQQRGFDDEDILYLNSHAPDIDLDGVQEPGHLDFDLSETGLNAAFVEAAETLRAGQQFILYMHGHARPGYLDLRPPYELSVQGLRQLLDSLPSGTEQIVILDSCYSGSFVAGLAAPGRIVISSADDNSPIWNVEYLSFSDKFINALRWGSSLGQAFDFARLELQNAVRFAGQTPWLDDDGNGLLNTGDGQMVNGLYLGHEAPLSPNPPEIIQVQVQNLDTGDVKMVNGFYFGRETPLSSNPPEIIQVHQTLNGGSAPLWVKTSPSADAIRDVRAILLSPNVRAREYQGRETAFARLETELVYNSALDRYESEYARFCTGGEWEILYQAQDKTGAWSEMKSGYLIQAPDVGDPVCDTGMSVKILLNQTRYAGGDVFRMELEMNGAGEAIPYVAIVLPDGNFFTYRYNDGFSIVNTPTPFLPLLPVNGKRTWPVMELALPEKGLIGGNYQACSVLMRADAEDVLDMANWLDWDCGMINYE
ncbi:MAG: PKD domain-containing protein [Gammaproteobacteria bacterium]|nr:PKD domain-containing protein [Gammaproteobacteria bacterium]